MEASAVRWRAVVRSVHCLALEGPATDYYRLLQVRRDASLDVIAAAYRRLMRDAHPDAGGDAEHALLLNRAYEVLSDPGRRRAYDATLPIHREDSLSQAVAYRMGVRIGRYAARWSRGAREARRKTSGMG